MRISSTGAYRPQIQNKSQAKPQDSSGPRFSGTPVTALQPFVAVAASGLLMASMLVLPKACESHHRNREKLLQQVTKQDGIIKRFGVLFNLPESASFQDVYKAWLIQGFQFVSAQEYWKRTLSTLESATLSQKYDTFFNEKMMSLFQVPQDLSPEDKTKHLAKALGDFIVAEIYTHGLGAINHAQRTAIQDMHDQGLMIQSDARIDISLKETVQNTSTDVLKRIAEAFEKQFPLP